MEPVASYVAQGSWTTLSLALVSIVMGTVLGTLMTLPSVVVRGIIRAYVETWRGLPIIITLFFIFFVLTVLSIDVNTFVAATVGLTLWAARTSLRSSAAPCGRSPVDSPRRPPSSVSRGGAALACGVRGPFTDRWSCCEAAVYWERDAGQVACVVAQEEGRCGGDLGAGAGLA